MDASVASQSKRREGNCTGWYSTGLRNQNVEHLVNLCESNILETKVNYQELYFMLKVQIALKLNSPRSCWKWMHLGRNVTYECLLSQSVFYQVLNAVSSDGVFNKRNFFMDR